ncbi:MAG: hypothetical protein JW852_05375 [Spirochaetales bacterium]|nr:hypothetical protein [Spirochaetales bacterium]
MKLYVSTARQSIISKFKPLEKSRLFELSITNPKELKKCLADTAGSTLVYIDVSTSNKAQITKLLKESAGDSQYRVGIVDETGVVDDPGQLFHQGAVDYISKKALQGGITAARLKKAFSFCNFETAAGDNVDVKPPAPEWRLSGSSWANVKSGQEYTFCLMFVEIDLIDEWKNKSGSAHLDEVKAAFQQHVGQFAAELSGKIWMWMDLCGLILFPFDGERCDQILGGMRLILNRAIISAEKYDYHTTISYKLAMHIGNTVYRSRGNTGTIVSDTVNFLFHVGHQFAQPGNFYLTGPVARFIPENLRECFVSAGVFEGVPIHRMRLPVSPSRRRAAAGGITISP